MAHKKGQGSTRNGRDSNPQYRGVKLYGGEFAKSGSIIVRQVGTKFKPGYMVRRATDDSLFAVCDGYVRYRTRAVDVIPIDESIPQYTAVERSAAGRNGNGNGNGQGHG